MAAASVLPEAPSLPRMFETWTPGRLLADEQLGRDLAVGPARRDERQDLALAGSQAELVARGRDRPDDVRRLVDRAGSAPARRDPRSGCWSGRAPIETTDACASLRTYRDLAAVSLPGEQRLGLAVFGVWAEVELVRFLARRGSGRPQAGVGGALEARPLRLAQGEDSRQA